MATLLEQLSYLNDTKQLIKQAIQNKGVEVPNRTTFRQYPDKINEIINEFNPVWTTNSAGDLTSVLLKDVLIFPTEVDGQAMSTNFNYTGTFESLWGIRKFVWPQYFLDVPFNDLWGSQTTSQFSRCEEIVCNATNAHDGALNGLGRLKKFTLPFHTGSLPWDFLNSNPVSNKLSIEAPVASDAFFGSIGTSTNIVELELNLPKIKTLGYSNSTETELQYCTGEWTLPSVTNLRYHKIPNYDQTLKLPAITQQTFSLGFNAGGSGVLHLYLGPNMTRCDCAANWVSHAQNIDIHIPAGDTATKATLDAAGVAYTQDYRI